MTENEAIEDFEMFCKGKILCVTGEALEMVRTAIKEDKQYKAIGTVEEFRKLKSYLAMIQQNCPMLQERC